MTQELDAAARAPFEVVVADKFDLPTKKRIAYAVAALDEIDIDEKIIDACVIYEAWLHDTPKDCEMVMPTKSLKAWLRSCDRDVQRELAAMKERLRQKWNASGGPCQADKPTSVSSPQTGESET